MKPYPGYKDSGIEWIGKIPKHWEIKKLKYCVKINQETLTESTDKNYGIKYIDISNVNSSGIIKLPKDMKFSESPSRARRILKNGDIIISTVRTYLKIIAFVNLDDNNLIASTGFAVLTPTEKIYKKYLYYFALNQKIIDTISSLSVGVSYPAINSSDLSSIFIWYPISIEEQKLIVNYLDRKTTQIDELIDKKHRLIELLKEQRAAMINRAVTKGLNPNAPMKDSGIEWLGKIPEHWEIKKLKWIINDKLKYGANEATETTDKSLPRYIRITDFGEDGRLIDDTFKSLSYEIAKDYLLKDGDILFARSGATVGKTFQYKDYKGIACFAGYLIKATPNPNFILSDFLYIYTKSDAYKNWINSVFIQATIQNIGADKYQSLFIPLPSIDEQRQITDVLKIKINRIEKFISNIDNEIELLKEFRTALISEVVTGKVDVRDEK